MYALEQGFQIREKSDQSALGFLSNLLQQQEEARPGSGDGRGGRRVEGGRAAVCGVMDELVSLPPPPPPPTLF